MLVLADARTEAPLGPVGYALGRLRDGLDVVAVGGRYLVMRRTRAWRAFDALVGRRDPAAVEERFLRRARQLGLACTVTHRTRAIARLAAPVCLPRRIAPSRASGRARLATAHPPMLPF